MPPKKTIQKRDARNIRKLLSLGLPIRKVPLAIRLAKATVDGTNRRCAGAVVRGNVEVIKHDLALTTGERFVLEFLNGHEMLQRLLPEVPATSRMSKERLNMFPMPWTLLLAADETWSGNPLAQSGRKCQIWSFSFLELGMENLELQCAWLTPMILRSVVQSKIAGQCSEATGLLLEHLLLCPMNGFATVGCPLRVGDDNQPVVLIASKVVKVLADGEGLRQFFQVKGASGIRCCPCCWNVQTVDSNMEGQRPEYINHACSNSAKFLKNAHCASIVDRLLKMDDDVRAGLVRKGVVDDYMKAHGMTPTPRAVLALKG